MKKYLYIICALLVVAAGCSGGPATPDALVNSDEAVADNRFGWGDIGSVESDDDAADEDTDDPTVTTPRPTDAPPVAVEGTIKRSFMVGEVLNAELNASGGSGSYVWSIESVDSHIYSFPEWVSLGEQTEDTVRIIGTAKAGKFRFKVKVCDEADDGNCDKKTFTVKVAQLEAVFPSVSLSINPCFMPLKISVVEYTKTPTPLPGCGTDSTLPGCTTLSEVSPNVAVLVEETVTIKFRASGKGPFVWNLNSFVEDLFPGEFCPPGMPGCGEENESAFDASVSSSVPDSGTNDLFTVRGHFMRGMPMTSAAVEGEPSPVIGYLGETLTVKAADECPVSAGSTDKRSAEKRYRFNITTPAEVIADSEGVNLLVEIRYDPEYDRGVIEFYDGVGIDEDHPYGHLVAKTGELDYPGYAGTATYIVPVRIVDGIYGSRTIESIKKIRFHNVDQDFDAVRIFSKYRHFYYSEGISHDDVLDAVWQISSGANAFCVPDQDVDDDGDDDTIIKINYYNELMPDECALEPL